jgi:phosphopantothenoylcysteine decarboxylase/phosphopantothenate--cysteine ligase
METPLKGKKILLGITGSIAAYKAPMLIRELVKLGAEVKTIITPSAKEFVTPITLASVSKNPVVCEMFDIPTQSGGAWHIHLAHWCDLAIIAPCSATTLGKFANGIADNALVSVFMAIPGTTPIFIAPAMDFTMYEFPATQRNLTTLREFGIGVIPPEEGELASGLSGPGRLADFSKIIDAISINLGKGRTTASQPYTISKERERELTERPLVTLDEAIEKDKFNAELEFSELKKKVESDKLSEFFKGKKVLITAGPTFEKIDAVRYISNFSSGKMGFALAEAACEYGAEVTLVTGPVQLASNSKVKRINVTTAEEMFDAVQSNFTRSDIIIMSAAVADFKPETQFENKLKKETAGEHLQINLVPNKDILLEMGKQKSVNQVLVGFALESDNEIENAKDKLLRKKADLIVLNSLKVEDSTFGSDNNQITIITRKNEISNYPKMTKKEVAVVILEEIKKYKQIDK